MRKTETKSDKNLARYLHARVIAGRGEGGRGAKGISSGRFICDSEGRRHASYVCAKQVLKLYWRCITHKLKTLRSTGKGRARVTQSHSERAKQIPCTVFEIVGLLSNKCLSMDARSRNTCTAISQSCVHRLVKSPTISKTVQGICVARSDWLRVTRARPFPVLRNVFSLWVMHLQYNLSTRLAHT
jgi:hypothetical protein